MKIALVGAPDSGKTALAERIAEAAQDKIVFDILDGYVERYADETNIAVGHFASYITNLSVAFERLRQEDLKAALVGKSDGDEDLNLITCGTAIDSAIYASLVGSVAAAHAPEDRKRSEFARTSTTMHAFGMLIADTWDYDLTFYLPYTNEYRDEHAGEWNTLLDLEYIGALIQFDIHTHVLDRGDDENLAKALQHIFERATRDAEPAPAD